jgi:hypothetical protein
MKMTDGMPDGMIKRAEARGGEAPVQPSALQSQSMSQEEFVNSNPKLKKLAAMFTAEMTRDRVKDELEVLEDTLEQLYAKREGLLRRCATSEGEEAQFIPHWIISTDRDIEQTIKLIEESRIIDQRNDAIEDEIINGEIPIIGSEENNQATQPETGLLPPPPENNFPSDGFWV